MISELITLLCLSLQNKCRCYLGKLGVRHLGKMRE